MKIHNLTLILVSLSIGAALAANAMGATAPEPCSVSVWSEDAHLQVQMQENLTRRGFQITQDETALYQVNVAPVEGAPLAVTVYKKANAYLENLVHAFEAAKSSEVIAQLNQDLETCVK